MEIIQMEIKWYSLWITLSLHFFHVISPKELTVMSGEWNAQQNITYQTVTVLSLRMIDTPASACLIKTPVIDGWWGVGDTNTWVKSSSVALSIFP